MSGFMLKKYLLYSLFACSVFGLILFIFWKQEYKYTRPTPVPENLNVISKGDSVDLTPFGEIYKDNVFVHFYNYDCPCSRFNIKEFESLVRKYSKQVQFIAIIQTQDKDVEQINWFKNKYDLGIPTLIDPNGDLANVLGVYSTPQAVLIKNNRVYYKGNYNKARFCTTRNTRFAELALSALVDGKEPPVLPLIAEIAYGCQLPSKKAKQLSLMQILNFE
ncbi:MAG: redoxin domain-containing protein [Cyclobacteriaceae bacterium]|nr:redoxin domain-containing protein [Cyclobacteriaceae bacterium]